MHTLCQVFVRRFTWALLFDTLQAQRRSDVVCVVDPASCHLTVVRLSNLLTARVEGGQPSVGLDSLGCINQGLYCRALQVGSTPCGWVV